MTEHETEQAITERIETEPTETEALPLRSEESDDEAAPDAETTEEPTPLSEEPSDREPSDREPSDREPSDELTLLREEAARLREELRQKSDERERALRELAEFHRLFPHTSADSLPEGVWEQVKGGVPLCAAYALYEKQREVALAHADEINRRNASLAAGGAGRNTASDYFSPEEVRAMSRSQVRENYARIMESMKTWL